MRYGSLAGLLAAVLVAACLAAMDTHVDADPVKKGLAVHEWGVFRVHDDLEMANADLREEWATLPKFFYGQTAGRTLPSNPREVLRLLTKPVVFFHAPEPLEFELQIQFPGGIPAVWWPRTSAPVLARDGSPSDGKTKEPHRYLEWRGRLVDSTKERANEVPSRPVEKGHWVEALRAVKANDVLAESNERAAGALDRVERTRSVERERFVYYDGLIPVGKRVKVSVEKDVVTVTNLAANRLLDLTAVDRRKSGEVRIARLAKLDAKAKEHKLVFKDTDAESWPAAGNEALAGQLKEVGLNEDEAKALAAVFEKDFFQADGLTVFYRLPQEEYEKLLPMKLKPRPEKLVRVGLVLHPHCEPDFAARVAEVAKGLDDDDFNSRERAQKRLEEMGRAAFAQLRKLRAQTKSPEMQRRLDELLDRHDAAGAIDP